MALEALAERRGRDLAADGIAVVSMGGVTNIGHFLAAYGPAGLDRRLAGLCDVGEMGVVWRALERAGVGTEHFYVCVEDLEDELIRAVGTDGVEQLIAAQGEQGSFRTFQKQASQHGRTRQQQLRRFMGTRGGRKIRYARLLVDALDLAQVPLPLDRLLAFV